MYKYFLYMLAGQCINIVGQKLHVNHFRELKGQVTLKGA